MANLKQVGTPTNSKNKDSISLDSMISTLDMAQSRFFTITIEGMGIQFNRNKDKLLPVQSIAYTLKSVENMQITLGLFRDVPIPTGIKLPKLSLVLNDTDQDEIQKQFEKWINLLTPTNGYVGYLSDLVKTLTYTAYGVDGSVVGGFKAPVILSDDFSTNRSYESNELKTMDIGLVIVGEGQTIK